MRATMTEWAAITTSRASRGRGPGRPRSSSRRPGVRFGSSPRPACSRPSRLDPGTAVLLRKADLPPDPDRGALLDLGCGYGPIACVLATVAPRATV